MDLFEFGQTGTLDGPDFSAEMTMSKRYGALVCGVDEVGRGPLAGPVVAAAVILDRENIPEGLNDSKKLTRKRRQTLSGLIWAEAVAVSIGEASVEEIDALNILSASLLAMRRAVTGLQPQPASALVDGNQNPRLSVPCQTLVKGDQRSLSVAAASIVAKVYRDDLMANLSHRYPAYGWDRNAGYGVRQHMEALSLVGVSPYHRRSFQPIRKVLDEKK